MPGEELIHFIFSPPLMGAGDGSPLSPPFYLSILRFQPIIEHFTLPSLLSIDGMAVTMAIEVLATSRNYEVERLRKFLCQSADDSSMLRPASTRIL